MRTTEIVLEKLVIHRGQSFTNRTNKPISYTNRYLNCFDLWQEHCDVLEPGQTFQHFNSGNTTFFIN